MLQIVFIIIILYIIIKQILEDDKNIKDPEAFNNMNLNLVNDENINMNNKLNSILNDRPKNQNITKKDNRKLKNDQILAENNLPWSRVLYDENDEYPYQFHIKLNIPSLNNFQDWHNIIPNLKFSPTTRELIIPSKDEPSALAIANLISSNFAGQLTMEDILNKNLIEISISKAKTHKIVQNKLREQIITLLKGNNLQDNLKNNITKNEINNQNNSEQSCQPNYKQNENSQELSNEIMAYEGNDYSYL